jgi:hypothetical protein
VTGLRLAHITTRIPLYQLNEAWEELNMAVMQMHLKITIPKADAEVGGSLLTSSSGLGALSTTQNWY